MSGARVLAIYRKDLRDASRDTRLIVALAMPLLLGLLYSLMFQDEIRPSVKLGVVSSAATTLPDTVKAATEQAVVLTVAPFSNEAALTQQVKDQEIDIGIVVPPGFDRDLAAGRSPALTVILPAAPTYGGDYVAAILDRVTQAMAGQPPAAAIERVTLPGQSGTAEAAFATLGARLIFVLIALILMLSMIAAYALPVTITEETEKGTLEALTLVASHAEVIAAKALFGLTYCVISMPLMLVVTRSAPKDTVLFAAAFFVSSVTLVGLGLLLGGIIKTQSQLNTWSSVVILPLLAPAIVMGLPTPAIVNAIVYMIPTAQTMRLGVNAFAGEAVFAREWLSFAILIGWAIVAYGLLCWRLARQENG